MKSTIVIFVLIALSFLPEQSSAQLRRAPDTTKSPKKAVELSAIPTVASMLAGGLLLNIAEENGPEESSLDDIGFGIWAAGVVVGPSLGYFYTKNDSKAQTGILIRGGAILGSFALFHFSNSHRNDRGSSRFAGELGIILRIAAVGSALYDILNVKKSVREYNRRHGLARLPKIQLTPIYLANQKAPGLGVRFTL